MADNDEILSRLTVYDVYGDNLKRSTRGFKMLCPFHEEKTPSFHVYSDTLRYHCFGGCGAGGNAFEFIMKRDKVDFATAKKYLAEKAGVDIDVKSGNGKFSRLYKITAEAMSVLSSMLESSGKAKSYLSVRGVTEESIKRFHLGYINSSSLVDLLKKKGFSEEDILFAGLAVKKDGSLKNIFFNRIMFPIVSGGRVRGFGGRILEDGDLKYINSPSTDIFQKSHLLYGMDPSAIRESGYAIVVEGNFDVVMCHQYGFRNTVAPLGTALTKEHVELLRKHCSFVVLVFDGDKSGSNASVRTAKLLFDCWMPGAVVLMPDGEDPDSFLRKGGDFKSLMDSAVPLSVYMSKHFPGTRKMLFHSLIKRGGMETAEFLAHLGTPEEKRMFQQYNAINMISRLLEKAPVVVRRDVFEVRKKDSCLALMSRGKFVMWEEIEDSDDYKTKSQEMLNRALKVIKRNRKHS